ncbi:MAG: glycosyltransferase family 9 protein [Chitinophagales bacterium]|nr:glycosyltransferase family 9 protein [Chitinophagales bacterium]MDW8427188.1 glycosyltransferase family 9 protein [Chitinophagales bacterium]
MHQEIGAQPLKFLIIQTAFLGDVLLATAVLEKLHQYFPTAQLDVLVKRGNESVLEHHPWVGRVWTIEKKKCRLQELLRIIRQVRYIGYNYVINLHRFTSSGLVTCFSGAPQRIGFRQNPFSFCYTYCVDHRFGIGPDGNYLHEIERNQLLIEHLTDAKPARPRIYISDASHQRVEQLCRQHNLHSFVCIAPASVWFTKQWPLEKWLELIKFLPTSLDVVLLGSADDRALCETLSQRAAQLSRKLINLAGVLSINETAALMQRAVMNYVNDSAPLHIASAVNAPVTAIFCSTLPAFGFGPLSDKSYVMESQERLSCRPCGMHGRRRCPEGHFRCALSIDARRAAAICSL